jgi:hypothetical protein
MQALAPPRGHSDLIEAVTWVSRVARRHLHRGAELVSSACLAAAVAWAFRYRQRDPLPDPRVARWSQPIVRFFFWTHVLGSRTYGRSRFDREVFEKAWFAGGRGVEFPYDRDDFQQVCYHDCERVEAWLPALPFPDDLANGTPASVGLLNLMKASQPLFLSVFQRIEHSPLDWDHIRDVLRDAAEVCQERGAANPTPPLCLRAQPVAEVLERSAGVAAHGRLAQRTEDLVSKRGLFDHHELEPCEHLRRNAALPELCRHGRARARPRIPSRFVELRPESTERHHAGFRPGARLPERRQAMEEGPGVWSDFLRRLEQIAELERFSSSLDLDDLHRLAHAVEHVEVFVSLQAVLALRPRRVA